MINMSYYRRSDIIIFVVYGFGLILLKLNIFGVFIIKKEVFFVK
jgi:hypothetical protein